jgi:hypothetical protein
MGARRWRRAAGPTANGGRRRALGRVARGRVAPAYASTRASRALAHSGGGTGLGPVVTPAPWRARATRVRRADVASRGATSCAGAPTFQTPFRLALFKSIFLQKFKQKCSKL